MSGFILEVSHEKEFFVLYGGSVEHFDKTGKQVYDGPLNNAPESVTAPLIKLGVIKPKA